MPWPTVGLPPQCVGWYGKIPSLGDFASRRLPQSFITAWDAWLQHGLAASRARFGERWIDLYLTSPIWRFALMPGVCTEEAWAGILMPSVDKVGRYFPLTLALSLEPRSATALNIFSAQAWFASLENLALSTLDIAASIEDLERGLADISFPAVVNSSDSQWSGARGLAHWWRELSVAPHSLQLQSPELVGELMNAVAQDVFAEAGLGKSVWWAVSGESSVTQLHCFSSLPSPEHFVALLEGVMAR